MLVCYRLKLPNNCFYVGYIEEDSDYFLFPWDGSPFKHEMSELGIDLEDVLFDFLAEFETEDEARSYIYNGYIKLINYGAGGLISAPVSNIEQSELGDYCLDCGCSGGEHKWWCSHNGRYKKIKLENGRPVYSNKTSYNDWLDKKLKERFGTSNKDKLVKYRKKPRRSYTESEVYKEEFLDPCYKCNNKDKSCKFYNTSCACYSPSCKYCGTTTDIHEENCPYSKNGSLYYDSEGSVVGIGFRCPICGMTRGHHSKDCSFSGSCVSIFDIEEVESKEERIDRLWWQV